MRETLHGTAPDGTHVQIDVTPPRLRDDQMCPAVMRGKFAPCCTLPAEHPGPWHIADTGAEIVAVWPVNP